MQKKSFHDNAERINSSTAFTMGIIFIHPYFIEDEIHQTPICKCMNPHIESDQCGQPKPVGVYVNSQE
ncbi:MAG: hypothetical protein BGO40_05965 [Chryseobacterium sp. 39-10]|nr:MAG: hypothetical protein BGO40_05965 [Chryseobacterium sp. 39-10]